MDFNKFITFHNNTHNPAQPQPGTIHNFILSKNKVKRKTMKSFLLGATSMLLFDMVYLSNVKPQWQSMISNIQKSKMELKLHSAIIVYLLMSFALYYFIILPKRSVFDAAILGMVIYGVFDMTNHALFKNYNLTTGIIDVVWGAILFASSAFIVKWFLRR